jgi:hypothetical protein
MTALGSWRPIYAAQATPGRPNGVLGAIEQQDFGFGKKRPNIAYAESAAGLIPESASRFRIREDLHRELETTLETGKAPIWTMGAFRKRVNRCCDRQLSNGPNLDAPIRGVKVRLWTHALGPCLRALVRGPVPGFVPLLEDRP